MSFTRDVLQQVLDDILYRPGWTFTLADEDGIPTLQVVALTQDSYQQEKQRRTRHSRTPTRCSSTAAWT